MIVEQDEQWTYCQCDRCGFRYRISSRRAKRIDYCVSCTATPLKQVTYGDKGYCVPHHGDFDADENPMRNGRLYKAGTRTCGHKDCVRDSHIEKLVKEPKIRAYIVPLEQLQAVIDAYKPQYAVIKSCQLIDCDNKFLSKGLCSKHYASWLRQTKQKANA